MNKTLAALCAAVALVSSAATAAPSAVMTDCQRGADAWKDAYNKHDAGALTNMYDAKTGMFSDDLWTATGHDALLAGFKQELAAGMTMTSITCVHSARQGHVLVSNGTWAATGKAPDGKDVSVTGHWMVIGTPGKKGVILTHLGNQQMQPPAPK
jgi:ketosteroid isomerase-like protein